MEKEKNPVKKETDKLPCVECKMLLAEIKTTLDIMNGNYMKLFIAMLGIIAATIGVKFIGTPWYVHAAIYSALFSTVFVAFSTLIYWRRLKFWRRWIRVIFVFIVLYVSLLRIYHYNLGTPLTQTEGFIMNILYILLCIGFVFRTWNDDGNKIFK